MPRWAYALFNLVFIAGLQNAPLLAITLPLWTMRAHPGDIGPAEWGLVVVFPGLLAGETVAAQRRWRFYRPTPTGGVLTTGLFRFSRHPNYFFEIAQWWVVFAFGPVASASPRARLRLVTLGAGSLRPVLHNSMRNARFGMLWFSIPNLLGYAGRSRPRKGAPMRREMKQTFAVPA